jgi:hypothetical protein
MNAVQNWIFVFFVVLLDNIVEGYVKAGRKKARKKEVDATRIAVWSSSCYKYVSWIKK